VKLVITRCVDATAQQVRDSGLFRNWVSYVDPKWKGKVTVEVADIWEEDGKIHALHLAVEEVGSRWPVRFILRTETVDILTILTDGIRYHVAFVTQFRPAAWQTVISNVAGGIEEGEGVEEAARREVREELRLDDTVMFSMRFSMRRLANPVLASPGMINERTHLLQAVAQMDANALTTLLKELEGKQTGVKAEGEVLKTFTRPAAEALNFIKLQPSPDAKTLLSLSLANL
jgi:8-oxo-dGTP pyrophosphatase MutT (NUDIX family)